MVKEEKSATTEYIAFVFLIMIVVLVVVSVVHVGSMIFYYEAISKPEFILMNQTCFEFCESRDMFFSYLSWTSGPKFKYCYCEKCEVFIGSVDQETYKTCDSEEVKFILERD